MEAGTQERVAPPRLKERYESEIKPRLQERFGYASSMQVPRVEKITLNMGVGEAKQDSSMLEAAQQQLATIAGQQPNVRRARKSIAAFKLRDGMPVGLQFLGQAFDESRMLGVAHAYEQAAGWYHKLPEIPAG